MKLFSAILFSAILLLQSAGLTFGTHYCGGQAVKKSLMIGSTDLDCGMAQMAKGCDTHSKEGINKEPCCQNEFISLHTDSEFDAGMDIPIPSEIVHFAVGEQEIAYWAPVRYSGDYSKYAPPLLDPDLNTLLQVFRI